MSLPLMEFPLSYDITRACIVDNTGMEVCLLSWGSKSDMEYLVQAANEKHARDNNTELDLFIETIEQEWK